MVAQDTLPGLLNFLLKAARQWPLHHAD
jgi:hypothetical protein